MEVTCPKCLEQAAVRVDVADGETLHCPTCDETYTVAAVEDVLTSWAKVLPWLKAHPARTTEAAART